MSEELNERRKKILLSVVKNFIVTGKPVGSKRIARASGLNVSAATIRNEMAALESLGLLEQPHTSAGRVPTDAAYRYFVDTLMEQPRSFEKDSEEVEKLFMQKTREIEGLFREASILLSDLTHSTAMVFAPFSQGDGIQHLEMVRLGKQNVMLIIITSRGQVGRQLLSLEKVVSHESLERVSSYLNSSIREAKQPGIDVDGVFGSAGFDEVEASILEAAIEAIRNYLGYKEEKVFVGGTANIVREMEYAGRECVQLLLEAMEKQYFILGILKELIDERQLTVRIGEENQRVELQRCSLIGTRYPVAPGLFGSLGVVGSVSMDYARAIRMVEVMADRLGHRFLNPGD